MIETLTEETRPVVTVKYEIEYGDESKSLAQLEKSDYQKSGTRMRIRDWFIEYSCTSFKLLIEILLEQIRLVVIEKFELEFRQKSIKNTLRFLGLSGLWCNEPVDWKINEILFIRCTVFDYDPHEGSQSCNYRQTAFRYLRWISFNNTFPEILDYQDFDARIRIIVFSTEPSSKGVGFLIDTLLEESISVLTGKFEFDFRRKPSKKFWFIGVSGFWCKNQLTEFLIKIFYLIVKVLIATRMKKIKPVVKKNNVPIIELNHLFCSCWEESAWTTRLHNVGTLRKFRTMRIVTQDTKPPFFNEVLFYN